MKKKKGNRLTKVPSQSEEINLSICMIVKDEETHLPRCLESVKDLGAELIIVDTGSRDRTVEIAREFGARVFHFPWNNHFSDARNESLKHATRNWILWLDADDVLPETEHAKLRKLAAKKPQRAYYFILKNRGIDDSQCYQLRMFPNRPEIRFEGAIHEQVARSIGRQNLPIEEQNVVIVHTGYSSPEIVRAKKEKYLQMMLAWLKEHPNDCPIQYQYALTLHNLDRYEESIAAFEHFLTHTGCLNQDRNMVFHAMILTARSFLNIGQLDKALSYLLEAQKLQPNSDFLKISLAETYTNRGEHDKAIQSLRLVGDLENPQITPMPLDYHVLRFGKEVLLAMNFTRLGKLKQAEIHLKKAEKIWPNRAELADAWGEWYEKKGQLQEAENAYEKAVHLEPDLFLYQFKRATIYLRQGKARDAKRGYEICQRLLPDKKEVLMNLGILERLYGRYEVSIGYLQRAALIGDVDPEIIFQQIVTLLDWNHPEESLEIVNKNGMPKSEKAALLYMLVYLEHGKLENFEDLFVLFLSQFKKNLFFAKQDIQIGFQNLGLHYEQENRFQEAELALRIYELLTPGILFSDREHLADVQMKSFHLNGAIATLEGLLVQPVKNRDRMRYFEKMKKCYQALGVRQAVEMCNQQIQNLVKAEEALSSVSTSVFE